MHEPIIGAESTTLKYGVYETAKVTLGQRRGRGMMDTCVAADGGGGGGILRTGVPATSVDLDAP
jgi:hypothetical protein